MVHILVMTGLLLSLLAASALAASGYTRKDSTYVAPYQRTVPDSNPYNNYGYPGNYNPNTGKTTTGSQDTYLDRYYDGQQKTPKSPWQQ